MYLITEQFTAVVSLTRSSATAEKQRVSCPHGGRLGPPAHSPFAPSVFFVLFLFFIVLYVCNNYIQLWAASIDGLRPTWQPAIIYTVLSTMYISSLANKIVVVVGYTYMRMVESETRNKRTSAKRTLR